jgi:mRNA interferase HigB
MHVITRRHLKEFGAIHPPSLVPLMAWHKVMQTTDFASFAELRRTYPSADLVGDKTVFNIGGNKYRLIAVIHYNRRKAYIRHVLTHADYDRGGWK